MQDPTHSLRNSTKHCREECHRAREYPHTVKVSAVWPFTWENKSSQLHPTTARGRYGTWRQMRTLWLVKVTVTGLQRSISIQPGLISLLQEEIDALSCGTSWAHLLRTHSLTSTHSQSGRWSSTIQVTLSFHLAEMVASSSMTYMLWRSDSNTASTQMPLTVLTSNHSLISS